MRYSVIIPVYNRPDEVDELLQSLTQQSFKDFEVIVVEDGSSIPASRSQRSIRNYWTCITMTSPTPAPGRPVTTGRNEARANT